MELSSVKIVLTFDTRSTFSGDFIAAKCAVDKLCRLQNQQKRFARKEKLGGQVRTHISKSVLDFSVKCDAQNFIHRRNWMERDALFHIVRYFVQITHVFFRNNNIGNAVAVCCNCLFF